MADVERYANDFKELASYATEFKGKVAKACGGSFSWGIEQVVDSYLSMFDRFCPFKVGDRVQLRQTCKIPENSGWYSSRHFLVKGAKATVMERGYSDGHFTFHVKFDSESWIDDKEVIHLIEEKNKHTYHFGENSLKAARETQ